MERLGKPCNFLHAKNIPPALASVEGLISTDLPQGMFDPKIGVLTCAEVANEIATELAKAASGELEQLAAMNEDFNFDELLGSTTNGTSGNPQGFHWHQ